MEATAAAMHYPNTDAVAGTLANNSSQLQQLDHVLNLRKASRRRRSQFSLAG